MLIIRNNKRKLSIVDKEELITDTKVYRYKGSRYLLPFETTSHLSSMEDWQTCYFNIPGKKTVIKGQLIPKNMGFKPSEFDDTYFENLDIINQYQKDLDPNKNYYLHFHDKTIGLHEFLKTQP